MRLNTIRDMSIIGGAIATGIAAVYLTLDDILASPPWRTPAPERQHVPIGVNFDLIEVTSEHDGRAKGTYIRPASELEAKSSEAAELVDDGPGVFAIVEGGEHVVPGTPEWDLLAAPRDFSSRPPKYYRVG